MHYPNMQPHQVSEIEWIKERYNYLLTTHNNKQFYDFERELFKAEQLLIDEERTKMYHDHIKPATVGKLFIFKP